MNAITARYRLLDNQELTETVERLENTVRELSKADTEISVRIRHDYQTALDAARSEEERRRC